MITFRKLRFSPSFDPFVVLNQPLFKAFWDSPSAKTRHHGLQMGPNHLFEHPEWSRISFGKTRFSPIFDPLLVPKRPIFKAFPDFPWPITHHYGLKTAYIHFSEDPKWSRNNFGKNDFFRPGDPDGPTVGPHRARAGLPPAPPSDHWYGGLSGSLGDSEAWKPQKVGGLRVD